MSILTDLKNTIVQIRMGLNNLSNRLFEVERSSIVSLCSAALSDFDAERDLYTTTTYTRANNTVAMRSALGSLNGTTGLYMQRTETYYNGTGVTIIRTVTYSITYNGLEQPIAEDIVSVSN